MSERGVWGSRTNNGVDPGQESRQDHGFDSFLLIQIMSPANMTSRGASPCLAHGPYVGGERFVQDIPAPGSTSEPTSGMLPKATAFYRAGRGG